MNCPQCQHTAYVLGQPCPVCGFNPPAEEVVQFANLHFLLGEIESWRDIPAWRKSQMRVDYGRQLRQVEIALGLRPAVFAPAEAAEMRRQLSQHNTLLDKLPLWQGRGWLDATTADSLRQHALGRQQTLQRHLEETIAHHLSPAEALAQNIANQQYLLELLELLGQDGHLTPEGQTTAVAAVQTELARLENRTPPATPTAVFLTSTPRTTEPPIDIQIGETIPALKKRLNKPTTATRPPREPWTWDKIWDSLLSERTLKAVLFLAVSLLFGGAVSIVVNEWQNFPPAAQAAFLVGFTAVFYALGWYVRQKMRLEGSGIALTAVASLLVPLDFYTFYISGGFPEGSWPTVWLVASAVCLVAYTATALALRAEFFGYFIALAATSFITAALNWGDVPWQWWQVPPVALALLLQLSSQSLDERLGFLRRPFQHMALGLSAPTVGTGLLLALFGNFGADVALPIAIAWWLGVGVLRLTLPIYPYRLTLIATLTALPIAVALTQNWLFLLTNTHFAWHGVGLAVVAGVYFWQGSRGAEEQGRFYSAIPIPHSAFTFQTLASLLVLLAATVSLGRLSATAVTHLLLAAVMGLASVWQARPRWLGWSGIFMAIASAAAQAYRGTSIPELALPWATLSIVYVLIALRLPPKWQAYRAVIVQTAVLTAGLALLPPLVLFDLRLLTYTLGHWIGLTAWLGYLIATRDWQLGETDVWNHPALWHALTAVPFPLWVLLLGREESADGRIIAQALTGWLIVALGLRLRRWTWLTHRPWQIATHLNTLLVCLLVGQGQAIWPTVLALLATAALYYTLATAYRWRWWLTFGVGFTYWGVFYWLAGQDGGRTAVALLLVATVALAITAAGGLAEGWRKTDHTWLHPLYWPNLLMGGGILLSVLVQANIYWASEYDFVWLAAVVGLLSANTLMYTWLSGQQRWGHTAVWLFVLAGGLFLKVYSQGSGRSAWLAALLAFAYVGAERLLHAAAIRRSNSKAPTNWPRLARRAWRLLRRPLLWGGWGVSFLAILGALGRNLVLLDGGLSRQLWSIASLATVTALYVCSAYWFRQIRWAWAATLVSTIAYSLAVDVLFDRWALASDYLRWELDPWFGVAWVVWAFVLAAVAVALGEQKGGRGAEERRSRGDWQSAIPIPQSPFLLPPLWGAHIIALFGLVVAMNSSFNKVAAAVTLVLLTLFYATAAGIDRRYGLGRSRMVYAASFVAFLATLAIAQAVWPRDGEFAAGLALLAIAIPALYLGRFLQRWDEDYPPPLYLLAHGALWFGLFGTLLSDQVVFQVWIAVLAWLFGALFYGLATAVHRRAGWLNTTTALVGLALLTAFNWLNIPIENWGLLFMAAVVGYLAIGRWLEDNWGWQEPTPPPFPRGNPLQWPVAAFEMATRWWAFPFYAAGLCGVVGSVFLTLVGEEAGRMVWVLAGGTAVWVWSMYRFKWRLYLLAAGAWAQWTAVAFFIWLGWPTEVEPFGFVLAFVTLATAAFGLLIEYALQEGAPFQQDEDGRWRAHFGGWSRMLYLLVAGDIFLWEALSTLPFDGNWHGGMTLVHALTVGLLATAWGWPLLMYATQLLGLMALWRWVGYGNWPFTAEAIATTFWTVATGVVGYGLSYLGRKLVHWPARVAAWARPLQTGSWGLSLIALAATLAVLDGSRTSAEMLVLNLALIGLFYLAVAVAEQRPRLAHVALLLLLVSWSVWLAVIQRQDEVQLYALPASAYLLVVGWVEWRYGFRTLAVLIDYAGFVLLLGSVFWQAFGVWGGLYALLMIGEGLILVWLGSARRMRRHLYAGVAAVLLAIISQILEPLLNLNAFVLLLLGGSLTALGIALERRLESVRALTKGFSHRLEDWD